MVAVMYAPGDLRIMEVCDGPHANGRCPRVPAGEEVPCWGLDIVLSKDEGVERGERFRVKPGTTVCPLVAMRIASMDILRSYFSPFAARG